MLTEFRPIPKPSDRIGGGMVNNITLERIMSCIFIMCPYTQAISRDSRQIKADVIFHENVR